MTNDKAKSYHLDGGGVTRAWMLTGICAVATAGFWWLFAGRDHYEDFQGFFPLILWLILMAMHAVFGSIVLILVAPERSRFILLPVQLYFWLSLVIHVGLLFDWMGWDEDLYESVNNQLFPLDKALHQALAEQDVQASDIEVLLKQGANADSWRGTWAIWRARALPDNDVLSLLLRYGANPDPR